MTDSPASTEAVAAVEPGPVQPVVLEAPDAQAAPVVRRRAVRKPSKPDAVLAAAVDAARNGVLEVSGEFSVGEHLGAFPEAERLVTHRFAASVPGYVGWHWFATLARVPRGKDVTVCEVGLLPSADALLAPDWVPWSERVRPEDTAEEEAAAPAPEVSGIPDTEGETDDAASAEDPTSPGDESPVA